MKSRRRSNAQIEADTKWSMGLRAKAQELAENSSPEAKAERSKIIESLRSTASMPFTGLHASRALESAAQKIETGWHLVPEEAFDKPEPEK